MPDHFDESKAIQACRTLIAYHNDDPIADYNDALDLAMEAVGELESAKDGKFESETEMRCPGCGRIEEREKSVLVAGWGPNCVELRCLGCDRVFKVYHVTIDRYISPPMEGKL